jgi:hypothetical protein
MGPPTLLVVFKMVLDVLVPLYHHMNFRINLSISSKKPAEVLIGIKPVHQFREYCHVNNLKSSDLWTLDIFLLI